MTFDRWCIYTCLYAYMYIDDVAEMECERSLSFDHRWQNIKK